MVPFDLKERRWFPIGSSLWPMCYLYHSVAICHRMSPTLKSTGGGSLRGKLIGGRCWQWRRQL